VDAATVGNQAGAIKVTWQAPAENGRPITKYVISGGGKSTEVSNTTTATLTGFGAGQTVAVEVRAVNEAGPSEPGAATAKTVSTPKLTITGSSATFNSATVSFSVDAGGGTATCALTGGGTGSSGNCSSLKATSLKASTGYTFTVTVKNAAGSVRASRPVTTAVVKGIATCEDQDTTDPATSTYCDADRDGRNGNEVFKSTSQSSTQVGWARPGTSWTAYCKKSGTSIDSYIYNDHKVSSEWVQINYSGKNYIPYAWFNLSGGADIGDLPAC
jgi:hypothetical protein